MINMNEGIWFVECRIDTRSIDLETGKPIPDTGDYYNCDCCGKEHTIWVYVYSKSGERGIVGTQCAKKASIHGKDLLGANYTLNRRNTYYYDQEKKKLIKRYGK